MLKSSAPVQLVNVPNEGLVKYLDKKVILMCATYFYTGILKGVNDHDVLLEDPAMVFETGPFTDKTWGDAQSLGVKEWGVRTAAIESYGCLDKK